MRGTVWCGSGYGTWGASMQHLTHATIVQPKTRIRRERLLPQEGEVIVRIGQEVTAVQVVARGHQEARFYILPASEQLQVPPDEVPNYLMVEKGALIEQGTPLLRKKRLVGGKSINSPIDGIFHDVSNGRLILLHAPEWIELRAMVHSRIINYISNRGVILEIAGALIQGVWGSGKDGHGRLRVIAETGATPVILNQVTAEINTQVLVVGKVDELDSLKAIENLGVRGLVAGSMTADLCIQAANLAFPIILTDGIGDQGMAQPILQLLKQHEGQETTLFARPQDHWGNRPEIIIPQPVIADVTPSYKPLAVGQTVRILRQPYSSQLGEVIKLYDYSRTTPIGTRVRGADVKLATGEVVLVPYENLDAII